MTGPHTSHLRERIISQTWTEEQLQLLHLRSLQGGLPARAAASQNCGGKGDLRHRRKHDEYRRLRDPALEKRQHGNSQP
eukprot:CAMPEP_0180265150 /NCGR_PEP_ID=MMETSP0988-20121125/279_1 /TAXON_ID=697907 /ORGANISM="non described non described, Strain CCMP2293" /LENGTH=78 /DNA_ID=CAMNT_0022235577 /DNA_START=37 /DNA_END=273 /DNA_ORIENTATION=-